MNQGSGIFSFTDDIEPQALAQVEKLSRLPFIHRHVAVMPDVHMGKGAAVGSVVATKGAVIPAAVGVDIGCGMIAARLNITANDLPDTLELVRDEIAKRIPLGVGGVHQHLAPSAVRKLSLLEGMWPGVDMASVKAKWANQMGTLGSGNHFIEICLDEEEKVWAVLHSGSRGIGNILAQKHIKIAQKLMEDYFIQLEDRDLAYFVEGTGEFKAYIRDMLWAQDFAIFNRQEMMGQVIAALRATLPELYIVKADLVNCHHNFTRQENHMGANVWVTRKGAIDAHAGQRGVIPGSMGTRSYVVTGLGYAPAFCSAPHGAGRRMSRKAAREKFTATDLAAQTEGVCCFRGEKLVDEIPAAYKDIDDVMARSERLVRVEHVLRQIVNVKGS